MQFIINCKTMVMFFIAACIELKLADESLQQRKIG
jgi:hypothetical protein